MQSAVLRECVFSLQGVSGDRYIRFFDQGDGVVNVRVSPYAKRTDRDALYLCGEAGCIYQTIQQTVCEYETHQSRISKAFAAAVTNELHLYTTSLTSLHARSVRQVLADTAPSVRSLKHLALITNTRLTGSDLLSWLNRLLQANVDSSFQTVLVRIHERTSRPWYKTLNAWIVQGTLDDFEFFVTSVPNVKPRVAWKSGHQLDQTKVPDGLLVEDQIALSYLVGKGVHYIRKVLCDMTWEPHSFDSVSDESLLEASRSVHSHILSVLHNKHNLHRHLHALKQFLLLGQGDFCATLLDGIHDTEGTIYKHTLSVIVDVALQGTVGLTKECCQRLHVSELDSLEAVHGAFGAAAVSPGSVWEVLTLNYTVPDPLVAIVHPEAMQTYQSMFRVLWSIRRVEHRLSHMWQQSSVLQRALHVNAQHLQVTVHTNANYAQAIAVLRQVAMVRQSMMHFVENLLSYLQMDVLQGAWKRLVNRVDTAETLDDIIAAHDSYLDAVSRQSFCKGNDHDMGLRITGLLGIANDFCTYQDAVFREALESVDRAAERRRQAEWLTDQGDWGFEQKDEEEESCFGLSDPSVLHELSGLAGLFRSEMKLLLIQLDEKLHGNSSVDVPQGETEQAIAESPTLGSLDNESMDSQDDLDALRFLAGQLSNNKFYGVAI